MKKLLCLLLVLTFLLPIYGCGENTPGTTETDYPYTVYEKPTFTPGTLESDLLTVENGNYDRASRTGDGHFLENGTGYYYIGDPVLRFADFSDLTSWVPVCDKPSCSHMNCAAAVDRVFMNDEGRLYFFASDTYKYLAPEYKEGNYMVVSMDTAGNDLRLEHIWPEATWKATPFACAPTFGRTGYVLTFLSQDTEGNMFGWIYVVDEALGELEIPTGQGIGTPFYLRDVFSVFGDTAYISWPYSDRLYLWARDGELATVTLPELPLMGGHWSGDTLRFYRTNDGYYDYDLLTGEETRIADAQVDDAAAWIIEPNCILETTLFESSDADQRAAVTTHTMKLFDGQTWHEVTLPEDIADGTTDVQFTALTSDSIILTHKTDTTETERGSTTFYRIALEQETYTLEQIGKFTA